MTAVVFAYECYADHDVLRFLTQACGLPLRGFHAFGQGEVVNEVLVRRRARLGMVDEDPGRVRHRLRDQMAVVSASTDVEWRRQGDRHLILVRPELEECVLRSFRRVQLASELPAMPAELHRLLNLPNRRKHELFQQELATAHRRAQERGASTFTTELERVVRLILAE